MKKASASHLRLVTEGLRHARADEESPEVGASISELQAQMGANQAAIVAAAMAAQAGTATDEQKALLLKLSQLAVQGAQAAQGVKLSEDKRTIIIPGPGGIPIPIPLTDLAEAAKVAELPKTAIGDAGASLGTMARVLGWFGENPRLALAVAGGAVATWFLGPVLLPVAAKKLLR